MWCINRCTRREALDLAFAMDCTSSMDEFILEAQYSIQYIVEQIVEKEKSNVHLALVEFRDHPPQDYSFVTRRHDFEASVNKMKHWLDACSAEGGGDIPEAVADALHEVLKLSWRPEATKICVLVVDAPPHGLDETEDGFPDGCPAGIDPVVMVRKLAQMGVTLYVVGCGLQAQLSKLFYSAMAYNTGGQYVPLIDAKSLAKVIIGGAQEEISLVALMDEFKKEVKEELDMYGKALNEEELTERVHAKLRSQGATSKQLFRNKAALPEVSDMAKQLSACTDMADIRAFFMSYTGEAETETTASPEDEVHDISASGGFVDDIPYADESSEVEEADVNITQAKHMDEVPSASSSGGFADEIPDADDSFEVEEAEVNLAQVQRMVHRAMVKNM